MSPADRSDWDARAVGKFALLSLVLGSAWTVRSIFNPVLDLAKADLALHDIQIGLAQGAALSLPAALLFIPLGRMVDTRNRIRLLLLLAVLTMLGSIATAFSSSFTDLVVYRIFTGLGMMGEAVVFSLAADLFPPEQRGRANAMIILSEYGGTALGFALAGWLLPLARFLPWLGDSEAWRAVPFLFGIVGLLLALPLLWLKEPPRREHAEGVAKSRLRESCRSLAGFGALLGPLLVAQAAAIATINMISMWAVPLFVRRFALSEAEGGELVAVIMFAAPLTGAAAAGILADRFGRHRGAITVAIGASVLALPGALFPIATSVSVAALLLAILLIGTMAAILCSSTVGVLAIPNELRGLWFGISATVTVPIGFALAPALVAWLAASMAGAYPLASALAILLFLSGVIAAAGFLFAGRSIVRLA